MRYQNVRKLDTKFMNVKQGSYVVKISIQSCYMPGYSKGHNKDDLIQANQGKGAN